MQAVLHRKTANFLECFPERLARNARVRVLVNSRGACHGSWAACAEGACKFAVHRKTAKFSRSERGAPPPPKRMHGNEKRYKADTRVAHGGCYGFTDGVLFVARRGFVRQGILTQVMKSTLQCTRSGRHSCSPRWVLRLYGWHVVWCAVGLYAASRGVKYNLKLKEGREGMEGAEGRPRSSWRKKI